MSDYRAMLASVGADVDAFTGSRMFRCPACSDQRKKKNEKCLSVRVDAEGFAFNCHHCQWSGGRTVDRPTSQRDDRSTVEAALRIWRDSLNPRGTVVETYLATRGLTLPDEIAGNVIRFHAALRYDGASLPGMVALFRDINDDKPCGIIRTFLTVKGQKIERRMLGRASNAAVKLDADENVEQGLHIGEGVETCIAAMLAGYRPVWALGSAVGIRKFPVQGGIDALTVLTEINDSGENARATDEVAGRWDEAGREVFTIEPLVGDDFNDVWRKAVMQ